METQVSNSPFLNSKSLQEYGDRRTVYREFGILAQGGKKSRGKKWGKEYTFKSPYVNI